MRLTCPHCQARIRLAGIITRRESDPPRLIPCHQCRGLVEVDPKNRTPDEVTYARDHFAS